MSSDDEGNEGPVPPGKVRRDAAIIVLLSAKTLKAAAEEIGVHERTIRKWLEQPDFAEALRVARRQTLMLATTRLAASANAATETLVKIFDDEEAPHAARVSAARTVIDNARGIVELDDLTERLRKLEQQAEGGADE